MIFHQPGNSRGNYNYNVFTYRGKDYAPHFHKNMELIVVQEGEVVLTVNGRTKSATAGMWALILSNQIHSFQVPETAQIWVAVFSLEYVPEFVSHIAGKQGTDFVFEPRSAVGELIRQEIMARAGTVMMRKACFYAVCDAFLEQVPLETRQDKGSFLVGQVLDWIAVNYTQDITLRQAAELFGYEYHYLSRLLNRDFAISFTQLLSSYRVEQAAQLLRSTDMPVTQIAAKSGFQSIRSFNLSFKNMLGCTPSVYRNCH